MDPNECTNIIHTKPATQTFNESLEIFALLNFILNFSLIAYVNASYGINGNLALKYPSKPVETTTKLTSKKTQRIKIDSGVGSNCTRNKVASIKNPNKNVIINCTIDSFKSNRLLKITWIIINKTFATIVIIPTDKPKDSENAYANEETGDTPKSA